MNSLSLRSKLFGVLGLLSVVAVAVAWVGLSRLSGMNAALANIVDVTSTRVLLAARIQQDLLAMHRAEKNIILEDTKEGMDKYAAELNSRHEELTKKLEQLRGIASEEGKRQIGEFDAAYSEFRKTSSEVQENTRRNTNQLAYELSTGEGRALYDKASAALIELANLNAATVSESIAKLKADTAGIDAQELDTVGAASGKALSAAQAVQDLLAMQRDEKNLILAQTVEDMDRFAQSMKEREAELTRRLADIEQTATAEGKQKLGEFRTHFEAWRANRDKVCALSRENSNAVARDLSRGAGREAFDRAATAMRAIADNNDKAMADDRTASARSYALARTLMLATSIAGISVAVLLGLLIVRSVVRALNSIIAGLDDGADQVNDAAGQVSTASQQLAEGSSEQASSLEETSSALEQVAAMTRNNADNALKANNLGTQARSAAQEGDRTVGELTKAMDAINESAGEIGKIIKVIEAIAFQTNLLALNAAVEAARAGDHGKGFAVVADEVRNLAQRAAQAAQETTALIEGSVTRTHEGTAVATQVAKALSTIVGDITQTTELVTGISQACQEQAEGVEQVNLAVSQMDKVTQLNASGAEESASAAEELAAQATAVKGMVDQLVAVVAGAGHRTRTSTATSRPAKRTSPAPKLHAPAASKASAKKAAPKPPALAKTKPPVVPTADDSFLPIEDSSIAQF